MSREPIYNHYRDPSNFSQIFSDRNVLKNKQAEEGLTTIETIRLKAIEDVIDGKLS